MRTRIRKGKRRICLPLPRWVLTRSLPDRRARKELRRALRQYRRAHGPLELVQIHAANGSEIRITI